MTMKRPRTPHRLAPFLDYTVHFSARSSRLRTRPEVSNFSNPGLTVALQLTVNPSGRASKRREHMPPSYGSGRPGTERRQRLKRLRPLSSGTREGGRGLPRRSRCSRCRPSSGSQMLVSTLRSRRKIRPRHRWTGNRPEMPGLCPLVWVA